MDITRVRKAALDSAASRSIFASVSALNSVADSSGSSILTKFSYVGDKYGSFGGAYPGVYGIPEYGRLLSSPVRLRLGRDSRIGPVIRRGIPALATHLFQTPGPR